MQEFSSSKVQVSETFEEFSSSKVSQESSSSVIQESSSSILDSSSKFDENMKALMNEEMKLSNEESSSSIVQKSSVTSQSVSKVSSSVISSSSDGQEPVVSCQIEESSTNEASASCSAIEMKNGELVSSVEQCAASKEESLRTAVKEGDTMVEDCVQL